MARMDASSIRCLRCVVNATPPGGNAVLPTRIRFNGGSPVDPLASFGLLRGDGEAALLLQRAGEGAADGMRLPAGRRDDLGDGGALGPAQHVDQHRLLGAVAMLAGLCGGFVRGRFLTACLGGSGGQRCAFVGGGGG